MKSKVLSLLLALILCVSFAIPAMAAEPQYVPPVFEEPELVSLLSSATVYLPDDLGMYDACEPLTSGPLVTLTSVYDYYQASVGSEPFFIYFIDPNGTISFNQDIPIIYEIERGQYADSPHYVRKTGVLKAGVAYNVKDFNAIIVVHDGKIQSPNVGDLIPAGRYIYFKAIEPAEADAYNYDNLSKFAASPFESTISMNQPSSWALESVNAAIAAGIVPEALQSQYTQSATRAEFCALAVALYGTATGKEITERTTFTDTADANVEKMAALGVVNGIGDGKFGPENKLTREQAATMLSRLAEVIGKPLTVQAPTFADNVDVSSWASDAVGQMQATGIMGGVGNNTFAPKGDYTREQSIITMMRLYEHVK